MKISKLQAGLIALLIVLLAGTASALPNDNQIIREPPPQPAGERIPVFLILEEQPQPPASFSQLKTETLSRQAQVLQMVRGVDVTASETAQSYWIANAIRVEVDPATLDRLAMLPGVSRIEPDLTITVNDPVVEVSSRLEPDYIHQTGNKNATVWSADFIEAPSVWKCGNTGEGVAIAVLDTGIDGDHPAFGDRITKFVDFINGWNETAYDDNGHGTHCAGTAAGGMVSHEGLSVTLGVAPGADLMGVKVLDEAGHGSTSTVLEGIQWAVENGADVISMSLGLSQDSKNRSLSGVALSEGKTTTTSHDVSSEWYKTDNGLYEPQFVLGRVIVSDPAHLQNLTITLKDAQGGVANGAEIDWLGFEHRENCYHFKAPYALNTANWTGTWKIEVTNTGGADIQIDEIGLAVYYQSGGETLLDTAVNNVIRQGIVVVASAGNDGYCGRSTISSPGTAKDAITVGATDCATDYLMDYRAAFSSMGPVNRAASYVKPDVMAPGVGIISAYPEWQYAVMDGTSMSCPAVAGAAALMLSGNTTLAPADVKTALMETAVHISENGIIQTESQPNNAYGAGRINAYEAVNITGGLGRTVPWNGIQHELFGGALTDWDSATGDTLKLMAVLWNTTSGMPVGGEEVLFSVDDPYNQVFINETRTTDENGQAYLEVDISDCSSSDYYIAITHGNLVVYDWVRNDTVTPASTPTVPIFDTVAYSARPDETIQIKYPLLNADGSPYTENVVFTITNPTGAEVVNEMITPEDGVIAYSLNLTRTSPGDSSLSIWINDQYAGCIRIGEEENIDQYVDVFPRCAICPPGESIDIAVMAKPYYGQKTLSQDFDVYVTTLTETEVLSLSPGSARALSTRTGSDMQALLAEIDAMKPGEYTSTVQVRNGVGLLDFTMPEGGYIALVRFGPYSGSEDLTTLVYGTLEPWLMHRSTPPATNEHHVIELLEIYASGDWPATWDQDAYASVPADEASITAVVYTYNMTSVACVPGQKVYLYTENGAQTNVTDANGVCTFTVDTSGKTELTYLLVTEGQTSINWIYGPYCPLNPIKESSVEPGMITSNPAAPMYTGTLYPDTEERIVRVDQKDGAYDVIVTSYGPDDAPIHEKGYFRFDRVPENTFWEVTETEAAATVDFTGTHTERVAVPTMEGYYYTGYGFLDPNSKNIARYASAMIHNPGRVISYTLDDSVIAGESMAVPFSVSNQEGTPLPGAQVMLALGAAADPDSFWHYSPWYHEDLRDENIWLAADDYPDPYTTIATGYTDPSGEVTLTFTAPDSSQQALRKTLAHGSVIPYMVTCYHDGELVQEDYGYIRVTDQRLPDFVPKVSAPHVVKFERDDKIKVTDVSLSISNQGTADHVYNSELNNTIHCVAEIGSHRQSETIKQSLPAGKTKPVLSVSIEASADDFGIDPNDYQLPVDVEIKVTVNPDRTVAELNYQNNQLMHPVRITAPDLAVEVLAPRYTTTASETAIGIRVTNHGEVGSNPASLAYGITGKREETIPVPALGANESVMLWQNQTLAAGDYRVSAEINRNGDSDYETTFANNCANATISSYRNPANRIEVPRELVLVPGTTYDLPITVSGVADLAAYQMDLTFNGSVLTVEEIIPGPLGLTAKNIRSGSVSFNGAKVSGVSGNVTVATVRFKVTGTTGDETALNLAAGLWDENGFAIPVEVRSGGAYLLLYGDANGDGEVNQADTLKVLRQVVGLDKKPLARTPEFLATDVTRNGVIDVGDAMFIAQYNADLRNEYFGLK